ncbi:MAG: TolC family protein [Spirochaetes bacterium]|nr:TolC family protein [Spirochaetota bacterium]
MFQRMMRTIAATAMLACMALFLLPETGAQAQGKAAADSGTAAQENRRIKIEYADEPAIVLGAMRITLGQAIEFAVKQNHDLLAAAYDVAMVDTAYNQFQKKFAPVLSANAGASYAQLPSSQSTFYGKKATQVGAGVGIYKNFSSGTTVAAGYKHEYLSKKMSDSFGSQLFSGMSGPAHPHKPEIYLMVQQELLKNSFGINDRKIDKILKNAMTMQKEAMIMLLSMVVVNVVSDYWTTVVAKVSLENAGLQVRETKKVRDITARNARYGLADDFQLNLYNAMLAGAEAKLLMARTQYRQSLRNFLSTINMDESLDVTGTAVFSNRYQPVDVEEALKTAYEKRADYRAAVMQLENAKLSLEMAKNNSLPSLNAVVQGKVSGENNSFGGSYGDIMQFKYPAIQGNLQMSYPIGDKEVYAAERNARFKVKQSEIELDKIKRGVRDNILESTDYIEATFQCYQKAVEARKQSELAYQGMLRDLRLGRLNSAIVKNTLDALIATRDAELSSVVGYNQSVLFFDVARNILFEKYNIDVDKYIPKDIKKK